MTKTSSGVYQLPNGMWGYRYAYMLNGKQRDLKRTKDENGNPFKTERAALRAREAAIIKEHLEQAQKPSIPIRYYTNITRTLQHLIIELTIVHYNLYS